MHDIPSCGYVTDYLNSLLGTCPWWLILGLSGVPPQTVRLKGPSFRNQNPDVGPESAFLRRQVQTSIWEVLL